MRQEKQRRNTPQRRIILEQLRAVDTHPTAAELFQLVRRQLPRISLGTVYRNLEVLCHDGKVARLELAGNETRFDGRTEAHQHIRCQGCGSVADLMDPPLEPATPSEMDGYMVLESRVEYVGLCPDCRTTASH